MTNSCKKIQLSKLLIFNSTTSLRPAKIIEHFSDKFYCFLDEYTVDEKSISL